MTTLFVALAALMLGAALAFVLRPLLRSGASAADPSALARRRLQVLDEAHATGVLSDKEFAAKRAELGAQVAQSSGAKPVRTRVAFASALAIAFFVPVAAIVLYRYVGEPRALDPAAIAPAAVSSQAQPEHGADMDQAIRGLADKLKQNPDDAQGWALLGRAYLETQHFAEARDALKHAHDLAGDDADVGVAYAEALALAGETHRIDAQSRALLEAALKKDPNNQRGIWLLGIADYQSGKFDDAIGHWNRLIAMLPKDSAVVQSVRNQIARAEADRDGRPPPAEQLVDAATATASTGSAAGAGIASTNAAADSPRASAAGAAPPAGTAATQGPTLTVKVSLDPKLSGKVAAGDTLFVYAKAASGPPMPLAIQRMQAGQLPATVVLSEGMGMLPNMKLSQFPQVVIGARISKSGNAMAQSGDLQTLSKPIDVATATPITLTIDQTVP